MTRTNLTPSSWNPWTRALVGGLLVALGGCDPAGTDGPDGSAPGVDARAPGADGATPPEDAGPLPDGSPPPADGGTPVGPSECEDGIDNDGDGYTDWRGDLGCYGPDDRTEASLPRAEEDGWTTFDIGADSVVVYVSADGDDGADGASPETAVATIERAAELVRDGENDFILLRRGDTWRGEDLGDFASGRDADHRMVIASYGDSMDRPRVEVERFFINHNGRTRSHLAIVGLHFVTYPLDPEDPAFTGEGGGGFRLVGSGSNILFEGNHFEYSELIVQSYGDGGGYADVEVRRNVMEKNYHSGTCSPGNPNGDPAHRPSGMYASHVDGLLIEENLLDHNGWNEDVETACATIYNHNLYLNGHDVVIRGNVLTRASSIHIKLRSDTTGDMHGLVIENNLFVEGEIGVSLGGNTDEPYRFEDSTVHRNVFSDIGRSQPTTRTLAWGVELSDNDGATITQNLFLNQREAGVGNSYALSLGGGTLRDVTVERNHFYRIQRMSIRARPESDRDHANIRIADNDLVDPDQLAALIDHAGRTDGYTYEGNRYYGSAPEDDWFVVDGSKVSLSGWESASGETGASAHASVPYSDPDRTIETYTASLGLGSTLEDYLSVARQQSRLGWRRDLSAPAINDYIRAGFGE